MSLVQSSRHGSPSHVSDDAEPTLIERIDAAGATPLKLPLLPATIPATWVPWKQSAEKSHGSPPATPDCVVSPFGQSLPWEEQAPSTTRPPRNEGFDFTPESMTATPP